MKNKTIVLALTSSVSLANEIVSQLGLPLGQCEVRHFADGEIMVELDQSVRGKDVFIVQSTCNPVSSNLMEVLICIDACKRASANSITCVMPYFGYARQDRKAKPRQPITAKLVSDLLEVAGADRIMTMELHASQIQGSSIFRSMILPPSVLSDITSKKRIWMMWSSYHRIMAE